MKLYEVFDKATDFKIVKDNSEHVEYDFKLPNPKPTGPVDIFYTVTFHRIPEDDQIYMASGPDVDGPVYLVDLTAMGVDSVTGWGNAHGVFATTRAILEDFKKRKSGHVLVTSKASVPSRVKLYSRMFDRIAKAKWKIPEQRVPNSVDIFTPEVAWLI